MENGIAIYLLFLDQEFILTFLAGEFWFSSVIIWQMLQAAAAEHKTLAIITEL